MTSVWCEALARACGLEAGRDSCSAEGHAIARIQIRLLCSYVTYLVAPTSFYSFNSTHVVVDKVNLSSYILHMYSCTKPQLAVA